MFRKVWGRLKKGLGMFVDDVWGSVWDMFGRFGEDDAIVLTFLGQVVGV